MNDLLSSERSYLRTPALSPDGSRIAFVYASDIWVVATAGGDAERLTAHPSTNSAPCWAPDGEHLAFRSNRTGQGDVYVLPLGGGAVQRVTFHDAAATPEAWSPDGAHVFFSSLRDQQNSAIYRVAATGGTPIAWIMQPYECINRLVLSPDGQQMAFTISRDSWWRRGPNPYGGSEIWVVRSALGADDYRALSDYRGMNRWPLWSPDGRGVYCVSDRGGVENLWFLPLDGGPARQITAFDGGRMLWPSLSADGDTLVFERDFGIWRLVLSSGEVAPVPIRVRQDSKITPVRVQQYTREISEFALAPDGKKVAFVVRGDIFADFADKETDRDQRQGPSFRVTRTHFRESDVVWSPDSRALIYVSDRYGDEEVFRYDFATHTETRLTNGPQSKYAPQVSPDGMWVAYGRGNDEIRLLNTITQEDRLFAAVHFSYSTSLTWSPDSRWVVFVGQDERLFSNLYVQRVDAAEAQQITFLSNIHAYGPLWAANGQFIIFTTSQYRAEAQIARVDLRPVMPLFREEEFEKLFEPSVDTSSDRAGSDQADTPVQADGELQPPVSRSDVPSVTIVFEGIERRLRFLTPIQMDAIAQRISPDSRDLIFSASVAGKQDLWTVALDEARRTQPPRQLTSSAGYKGAVHFAPDGKSFSFLESGQIAMRKFPAGEQTGLPVSAEVEIDFHQEKRQIFGECWRLLRDHFYDPTFRGVDWQAVYQEFEPLVNGAQTPSDLLATLYLMIGELRASHVHIVPGGSAPIYNGYLGIIFDRAEQVATGRLRVAAIVPDSPAALLDAEQRIQIGEYVLAVDGVALAPTSNLDRLLQRTVRRRVRVRVGQDPDDVQSAREVALCPISASHYDHLRYRGWVVANEAYVHRISAGRLGYVHVRDMMYDSYQQFLVDLDVETHSKEGVVIDLRFNGGGHMATFILDVLARRSVLLSQVRNRPPADAGHLAGNRVLNKPTVLVINESSGSNAEMFAEGYQRLGLGYVVGMPSAGAVIWTTGKQLLDGSTLRVPYIKVFTPEGEDLEGTGRTVDIACGRVMGEALRNQDSQLAAAVQSLLAQIDGEGGFHP